MPQVVALALNVAALVPGNFWYALASAAVSLGDASVQRKRARRRARDQHNASLQDRLVMVDLQPDAPRTLALGRVRTVEGVRRRWASGADDRKLTLLVSLAGHEIDAVEQVYFDDVPVSLDGSGYVTTEPYAKTRTESASASVVLDGSGAGVVVLPHEPLPDTVRAVWVFGSGDGSNEGTPTIDSIVGTSVTLSGGLPGATATVSFQYTQSTFTARVRAFLGAPGQNVGAALAAEYPGKISAAERAEGIALLVVDLDYDPDVYPQGYPNVTALIRGAKVYDPRADSTAGGSGAQRLADPATWAWSENPALLAYHYGRHANGWAVPAAEIMPAAAVAAEADWCDATTAFTLRKPGVVGPVAPISLPRHRCGIVISTAGEPGAAMDEILETMAGRAGWAGGVWRFRAGRMPASVFAMDQTWLARRLQEDGTPEAGPTLQFSNGVAREAKVNRVAGKCVDPDQRHQVLPFPAVEDPVLIAAEGQVYPLEVEYQGVNHIAHAQHLASVAIRRQQAALRLQAQCNLHAYRCELFDAGTLTLPTYGISAKPMEVVGWRWHPAEGVQLQLAEISDAIFTVEPELGGRDPAPNTTLPSPWDVEALTGLAASSSPTELADGTLTTRLVITWNAAVAQSIRAGGSVEVQYRRAASAEDWQTWVEDGTAARAVIPGLRQRAYYVVRARFVSAPPLRVRGDWSEMVLHLLEGVPPLDTGGIAPGAATQVYAPLVSGASFPVTTAGEVLLSPRTLTPEFDCVAEVTCTFEGAASVAWDVGTGRFYVMAVESADTFDDGGEQYVPTTISVGDRQGPYPANTTRSSLTIGGRFDLTAGVEVRLGLLLKGASAGPLYTATCYALTTHVTLIKR